MNRVVVVSFWLLLSVSVVGCWSGDPTPFPLRGPLVTRVAVGGTQVSYAAPPTATAWPTFTAVPTATPAPTREPWPMPSPKPTVAATYVSRSESPVRTPTVAVVQVSGSVGPGLSPTASARPTLVVAGPSPTPYGQLSGLEGGEASFRHQSLFPSAVAALPDLYITGDPADLPRGAEFISRMTPFVIWVVVYDTSQALDGWEMEGTVRWIDVNGGPNSLVMVSSPMRLTKADFMFTQGLGRALPGFWQAGRTYRVEFLNEDAEVAVSWDFEVR